MTRRLTGSMNPPVRLVPCLSKPSFPSCTTASMRFTTTWLWVASPGESALMPAMLARFKEIAEARCSGWGGHLMELNGEADHVHLLIALPPNLDLSKFVNNLKTTSSRLLRKEFAEKVKRVYRKGVFWSRSYCIISCGGAPLSTLKQYIEQQMLWGALHPQPSATALWLEHWAQEGVGRRSRRRCRRLSSHPCGRRGSESLAPCPILHSDADGTRGHPRARDCLDAEAGFVRNACANRASGSRWRAAHGLRMNAWTWSRRASPRGPLSRGSGMPRNQQECG